MLRYQNIHKHYGDVAALKGASWNLFLDEVHALCGENGAGKSPFSRIHSGITSTDASEILLENRPIAWSGPSKRVRRVLV